MYLFMCRHVHMFLGPVFSFLVLKLLWNSHLPENMFMCTNVMKGKKERNEFWLWLVVVRSVVTLGNLLWSLNPALEEILLPRFINPLCWQAVLLVQESGCPGETEHISSAILGFLWGWWKPAVQALRCMLPLQRGSLERVVMVWCVHSNLCY